MVAPKSKQLECLIRAKLQILNLGSESAFFNAVMVVLLEEWRVSNDITVSNYSHNE